MKQVEYKVQINAPREKVWKTLWEDKTYREWTKVFHEGSYAESDWKEGSKILFLGPGKSGMYSMIDKMVPNEKMYFKHLGEVKSGVEQPIDESTKSWSGAKENYTLTEKDGGTELKAEMDSTDEMYDYFKDKFPKAMQLVKEISEK